MKRNKVLRTGTIGVLMIFTSLISSCAPVHYDSKKTWKLQPGTPIQYNGFSILPPQEKEWVAQKGAPGERTLACFSRFPSKQEAGAGAPHTVVALVMAARQPDVPRHNRKELINYLTDRLKKEWWGEERHEPVSFEASEDTKAGPYCIKWSLTVEDRGVPGYTGEVFMFGGSGLRCAHPDLTSLVTDVSYTQRFRQGGKWIAKFDPAAEAFLKSFRFTSFNDPRNLVLHNVEEYAILLREKNQEAEAEKTEQRTKLMAKAFRTSESTYLGFNPSEVLRKYSVLLHQENRKEKAKEINSLADWYQQLNKEAASKGEYDMTIEKNLNSVRTYYSSGLAYQGKGQYDKAIADYNKAIKINPRFSMAYKNRGSAYYNKGQYDKAISDFNKAIEIDPMFADAYNDRGNAYKDKGQYDKAFEDYNRAIDLNPMPAGYYLSRGNAYSHKGQHDMAISDFNKAIEINPRYGYAYYNRGNAYSSKGQHDRAISDYNNAIGLNPLDVRAYNNRGLAYSQKGMYDRAVSDHSKAIEINPKHASAYNNRGVAYKLKGQNDQAISDFNKAIEISPKFALAYGNRGEAYFSKKEYDKAWNDVDKAQALGYKTDPDFLKNLREASGRER